MDFFMGGMIMFGGTFAPKDWAFCQGATVAISENQALYAILGTTYGGDGRSNFMLPDLRSHVPAGIGTYPGMQPIFQGHHVGTQTYQLSQSQMPTHAHNATFTPSGGGSGSLTATATFTASGGEATSAAPIAGGYLAKANAPASSGPDRDEFIYSDTLSTPTSLASDAVTVDITGNSGGITGGTVTVDTAGSSAAFPLMQPTIGTNYIIALQGIFPSRN
jgi:microcystin-dependent protein